jgi:ubiquinone biosynthesis protein COQ4
MLFNLQQRLQSLRIVASLAEFLKHPDSPESVFKIVGSHKNSAMSAQMFRHLLENPSMKALVDENWRPNPIDLDALELLPEGTLGHEYAHQLRCQGLTPDSLIDPNPITSPQDYVTHRQR